MKNFLNFSSSGFVSDGFVVTVTSFVGTFVCLEDLHCVRVAGEVKRPKTKARFYFYHANAWVPLKLFMVKKVKEELKLSLEEYYLIYFESDFPLPCEINEKIALSSPLGILGVELYLNQVSQCEPEKQLSQLTSLVKFPHFPGSEGSYYGGKILLRSKLKGYCLAYTLPKL